MLFRCFNIGCNVCFTVRTKRVFSGGTPHNGLLGGSARKGTFLFRDKGIGDGRAIKPNPSLRGRHLDFKICWIPLQTPAPGARFQRPPVENRLRRHWVYNWNGRDLTGLKGGKGSRRSTLEPAPVVQRPDNFIRWIGHNSGSKIYFTLNVHSQT